MAVPTACLQIDTYAYLHRRLLWAMLFDYVLIFHPGYENQFVNAGHTKAFVQPHAVEADLFVQIPHQNRTNDIGWVGRLDGSLYSRRRHLIPRLAETFRMNDWHRSYSYEEMSRIYGISKIGLNISRDDHPEDANLRVFEIMAAGAMLVTSLPSELEKFGFQSGRHFVGYAHEPELTDRVRYYLQYDTERERIAAAGCELVLREHTYDRRAEEILRILDQDRGRLFAPARSWPEERVRQVYLDYYCAHNLLSCALGELHRLAVIRPPAAWKSLPPIVGALRRGLRNWTMDLTNLWAHK
jgi:spore maturation protein CgeB